MPSDPLIGRTIHEKYRLDAEIGVGGMATVYRATRLHIGDAVAVKVLHAELLREPKFAERFQREAQAAARLKHPNVVAVHDFGVCEDGLTYLVMELVEGRNLRAVIKEDGPMTAAAAAEIVRQVGAALTEAHRHDLVHRDIKPANIAIDRSTDAIRVKVLDFGIASLRGGTMMTFTQTGAVMGTPAYMSPEQCLGEELDGRSDIYSLGVVLFEMLCGVVPFNSPTATAVVMQHVQQAPPPLRVLNVSVSAAVEAVVLRALAKQREERFQTAREFADALTAAVAGTGAPYVGAFAAQPFAPGEAERTMMQSAFRVPAALAPGPPAPPPAHRGGPARIAVGVGVVALLAAAGIGAQRLSARQAPPLQSPSPVAAVAQARTAHASSNTRFAPRRIAELPHVDAQPTPALGSDVLGILYQTREMEVLGSSGCGAANAVLIRFKENGTSGCAWYTAAVRGALESGSNVMLVPVTRAGLGRAFDLLYDDDGAPVRFIGILPGDGSGHLTVTLENGLIVERNGYREKRSTLRSGRIVVVGTGEYAPGPSADTVVRTYYALWNAGRLPEAYGLLSSRYQAAHPYGGWTASHRDTVRISVETSPTNDPLAVAVVVRATDRTPDGVEDSEYRGAWRAVREGGTAKLDDVTLERKH